MVEIGMFVVFVLFIIFGVRYIYPAARLANELKATFKAKGYWFPEEWE